MARKHHAPYAPTDQDLAVALALGPNAAFLVGPDGIWCAQASTVAGAPRSAVVDLIIGIWETAPVSARSLLRNRILTTSTLSAADRATVSVAARRATGGLVGRPGPIPAARVDVGPAAASGRGRALDACFPVDAAPVGSRTGTAAAYVRPGTGRPATRDRPVAAVLFGPDGQPLLGARNASGQDRVLHAEMNLLFGWFARSGAGPPAGSIVATSLQPCRMCAEWILHCSSGAARVEYAEPDPGRLARNTVLAQRGLERHVPWVRDPPAG